VDMQKQTNRRHAAILGLGALIEAFPYATPPPEWMPEVLATLATQHLGRPVHPNDHVNASQSSNDVFPSAIHVAATRAIGLPAAVLAAESVLGEIEDALLSAGAVAVPEAVREDRVPIVTGVRGGGGSLSLRESPCRARSAPGGG